MAIHGWLGGESVALSCFEDEEAPPGGAEIERALGSSATLWSSLIEYTGRKYPPMEEEWAFSGSRFGWSLRLVHKKRRILYLIPQEGSFLAAVVLGDRAVDAATGSALPKRLIDEINGARKYAEGRGIRWRVESREDLQAAELLADIKMGNA